jgi:hypothetical protein
VRALWIGAEWGCAVIVVIGFGAAAVYLLSLMAGHDDD